MDHDPNQELNPNALLAGVAIFFCFALTTVGYIIYASESAMASDAPAAAANAEDGEPAPAEAKKASKPKGGKAKAGNKTKH